MTSLREHLKRIAPSGGKGQKKKYSKEQLSDWGKLGGRPRKKPVK